jgi:uncharacterized membrane protein YqjE
MIMSSEDRPISVVVRDVVGDVQEIVRSEVRLAKAELREEVRQARSASVLVGIGALSGIFSVLFLLLAAVYALRLVMPDWAAALIVAAGIAIVAGVTLRQGLSRFKTVRPLQKTLASLKEDVQWAKQPPK